MWKLTWQLTCAAELQGWPLLLLTRTRMRVLEGRRVEGRRLVGERERKGREGMKLQLLMYH